MKNNRHHQHHKNGHKHSCTSRFGARLTGIALAAVLATGMTTGMLGTAHADDVVTYVHADHLGSPVAETNSLGQVTRNQVYSPYGETHLSADGDTAGFTGHRNDADTGLVYMQARYYDPISGRFLSTDPVTFSADKPEHFNRYWYVNGNPYRFLDTNGEAAIFFMRAPVFFRPRVTRYYNTPKPPGFQTARPQPGNLPPRWPGESVSDWLGKVDKSLGKDLLKLNSELRTPPNYGPQVSEFPTTLLAKLAASLNQIANMINGNSGLVEGTVMEIQWEDADGNTGTTTFEFQDGEWVDPSQEQSDEIEEKLLSGESVEI